MKNKYLLLTVDVEALPKRAVDNHVNKLMWGIHNAGRAGVAEISQIGQEFNARHIFFVDYCGALSRKREIDNVAHWLASRGEDVQLHMHPEYLPENYWIKNGFDINPKHANKYNYKKSVFILRHFSKILENSVGKPPIAFRAGSFRWNSDTIRAMKRVGIPLSFNNSCHAFHQKRNTYSHPTNFPYLWDNGIVEVPVTEKKIFSFIKENWWARFQYPFTEYFTRPINRFFYPIGPVCGNSINVLLLHSWSLLYWDENGHAEYRGDARIEAYRKMLKNLTKQFDVITTVEFLDLYKAGKFGQLDNIDLNLANYVSDKRV